MIGAALRYRTRLTDLHIFFDLTIDQMASKIIIIDDEKTIRDTLREILEYEKYVVDEAKDGEEAYNMLIKEK